MVSEISGSLIEHDFVFPLKSWNFNLAKIEIFIPISEQIDFHLTTYYFVCYLLLYIIKTNLGHLQDLIRHDAVSMQIYNVNEFYYIIGFTIICFLNLKSICNWKNFDNCNCNFLFRSKVSLVAQNLILHASFV